METMSKFLTGRRVLVVEDEYYIADDLAMALHELGAEVLGPVPTQAGALSAIAGSDRIDAAVLDVNLRGETALPVIDALSRSGVPFVFATGYDAQVLPERYRHIPRWEKPYDAARLAESLPQVFVRPLDAEAQLRETQSSSC